MPPPRPSAGPPKDRRVVHEVEQLVRALRIEGTQTPEELARLVGGAYWEPGRFDRALTYAISDGLVVRSTDGRVSAV